MLELAKQAAAAEPVIDATDAGERDRLLGKPRQVDDPHLADRESREDVGRPGGGDEAQPGEGLLEVCVVGRPIRLVEERTDARTRLLVEIDRLGDLEPKRRVIHSRRQYRHAGHLWQGGRMRARHDG